MCHFQPLRNKDSIGIGKKESTLSKLCPRSLVANLTRVFSNAGGWAPLLEFVIPQDWGWPENVHYKFPGDTEAAGTTL